MKETKLLVVGPPDRGKTSWFAPFQGMLANIDLLFSSGIRNDTGQIFIVTNDFKKAEDSFRKGKIYEIVGVINLTEINH